MKDLLVKMFMAVIDKVFKLFKPTAGNGSGPGALEQRLRKKVKKDGWNDK